MFFNLFVFILFCDFNTSSAVLDPPIQNYYRYLVVVNLNKVINNCNTNNDIRNKQECNIIKRMKLKLNNRSLTISKADKGKTLVILAIRNIQKQSTLFS